MIAVFGYYGFGNAGDECILRALVDGLREQDAALRITVASATPALTAARYGGESFLWSESASVQRAVDCADLVIVGGGGLFHDYHGLDPNAFLTDQQTGIAYYTAPAVLASLQSKPVMLCGVGVGPLFSEQARIFTRAAADAAAIITVRDEESRSILLELGVDASAVHVTADPAFSFAVECAPGQIKPGRPVLGVSVRPWSQLISPVQWESEVAAALDRFIERNDASVIFLPFQNLPDTTEDDGRVIGRIRGLMIRGERTTVAEHSTDPKEILASLGQCDLVLAMRLHAAILGACASRPVVALSYDGKVRSAMRRMGGENRVEDLYRISAVSLCGRLEKALASGVRPAVTKRISALSRAARENARQALTLLNGQTRGSEFGENGALLTRSIRSLLQRDHAAQAEQRRLVSDIGITMNRVRELEQSLAEYAQTVSELEKERAARLSVESERNHAREALSEAERVREALAASVAVLEDEKGELSARISGQDREREVLAAAAGETRRLLEARDIELARQAVAFGDAERERDRLAALAAETGRALEARDIEFAQQAAAFGAVERERDRLAALAEVTRRALEVRDVEYARKAEALDHAERERDRLREEVDSVRSELVQADAAFIAKRERWDAESAGQQERERTLRDLLNATSADLSGTLADLKAMEARCLSGEQASQRHAAHLEAQARQEMADVERAWRRQFEDRAATLTDAARGFESEFERQLLIYRNQRAWQLMLLARKTYDLVTRGGWTGRMEAVALGAKTLSGAPLELAAWDLRFPSVWNHLPAQLFESTIRAEAQPSRLPKRALPDILVFPVFDFEFRFQRPQQIAAELARRGHRVFWVSPSRRVTKTSRGYGTIPLRDNLVEVQLDCRAFDLYGGALDPGAEEPGVEALRNLYRDEGIAESAVLIQFPFWRRFALPLRQEFGARLLYDKMDDWEHWPVEPRISAFNLEEEQRLIAECDSLVVTAREMAERYRDNTPAPLLIANGADFEFFRRAEPHPALAQTNRPVIGYYGAIAPWFDLELLIALARARPDYTFVLIGAVHGIDVTPLKKLPNVHMPGEKNYRELPSYLAAFDVCLIPFRINSLTKAVDPVKMYEYCSQGKPVVASRMPEIAHLDGIIRFAEGTDAFLNAIDESLGEQGRELREARIAFARENTWSARTSSFLSAIHSAYPIVSIVILTYNSREFAGGCYEAIRRNTRYPNYELIFVDNASTDGTADLLRNLASFDSSVRLLLLDRNVGFAEGNNRGVGIAAGSFIVLLNADTVPSQGWLHRLVSVLRRQSDCGLVAPVTNYSGNETKIDFDYRDMAGMEDFAARRAREFAGQVLDVPMAPLLCGAFRRELWDEIGPLDPQFEIGMFEDDDFSIRVRRAKLRIVTAEDCFVHHFGGGSFQQIAPAESLRVFEANRQRLEKKWGIVWQPHRLRIGVRPPDREFRITPAMFGPIRNGVPPPISIRPSITRLLPDSTPVGTPMNPQGNGWAALVVECTQATPDTVVEWNSEPLQTAFGGPNLVSALVPAESLADSRQIAITLTNHFGSSERTIFRVQGHQG